MTLAIRSLTPDHHEQWDKFLLAHPDSTPFHLTAWKRVIERQFGCQSRCLFAEEGGRVTGVLPLFEFSNAIVGRALISSPFAVYGGVCASDSTSEQALAEAACALAHERRVEYLELRQRTAKDGSKLLRKDLYVSFDQDLPASEDALMKSLPRDTRYMIRKALRNGLRVTTEGDQLDVFHHLYAISVRNLGTPVFSKQYFQVLQEEFANNSETMVVWKDETPLAAVLSLTHRDWILPYYGGSTYEARQFAANDFMYYELMRSAMKRGFRHFDFGRSKVNSGSYHFKTQWNMREHPLTYEYLLVKRREMPNFSPVNPRMRLAVSLWKHVPLPIANTIGPRLVRLFP